MSMVAVADESPRDLPCSERHDEWIEVLKLLVCGLRRSGVLIL